MKIAFILPSLAFAGPILVAKYIIDHLSQENEIDVYYFDNKVELEINANLYQINLFTPIDFKKYDIIHTHMFRPDFYMFFWSMFRPNKIMLWEWGYCKLSIYLGGNQ